MKRRRCEKDAMFDRLPPSASETARPVASTPPPSLRNQEVEGLCRLFDRRLSDRGGELSPSHRRELDALAARYGLAIDRPAAQVWRDLRAVISRTVGRASEPPVAEPASAPTQAPVPLEAGPLTVLVVEDDPEAAAALTELLTEAGHRVIGPFHSAAPAEAAAALHPIDAALLDVNLSDGATGRGLAERLKRRWDMRVVLTAGDVEAVRRADPAETVVFKPYTGAQILAALAGRGRDG
ncbi:response regulator [Brevundimonas aurantiaca]|uniref:response regulator n=1 Tax=Brevundimonas aurantiaca TaxID=74316 RepID=UPI0030189998